MTCDFQVNIPNVEAPSGGLKGKKKGIKETGQIVQMIQRIYFLLKQAKCILKQMSLFELSAVQLH